ncbi:MAG: EcsC family protein [Romboutsia sp.]
MNNYNINAIKELEKWKKGMRKNPSIIERTSKGMQNKFNDILPKKYHEIMTSAIKNMIKTVLFGYKYVTKKPYKNITLEERELLASQKIKNYKTAARIEGAGTGAGGILIGLTDLPLLLGIKVKLLYDIAAIYGYDVSDYRERIYILYILQLAFSSKKNMNDIFLKMENWKEYSNTLPQNVNDFDWRNFQQEYRDYLDLAKLFQLMPGIGAVVGFYINGKLIDRLSKMAIFSYRMRSNELNNKFI